MTPEHKEAIRQSVIKMRQRRRRSAAMKKSWRRRHRNNNEQTPAVNSPLDAFSRIELTCKLWKGLETEKTWYQNYPEVLNVINGAITNLRLEVILVCREYLGRDF
jgi:hypothetical protein